MDAQILFILEGKRHGVRDASDPQLDGVAVVDQGCNVLSDGILSFPILPLGSTGRGVLPSIT
jgi:hypothetical protein